MLLDLLDVRPRFKRAKKSRKNKRTVKKYFIGDSFNNSFRMFYINRVMAVK